MKVVLLDEHGSPIGDGDDEDDESTFAANPDSVNCADLEPEVLMTSSNDPSFPINVNGDATIWSNNNNSAARRIDRLATGTFISIVGSEEIQRKFAIPNCPKKSVWIEVATLMSEAGFHLGPNAGGKCHQKWRNLERRYRAYKFKRNAAGKRKQLKPEFYDQLHKVIMNKSCSAAATTEYPILRKRLNDITGSPRPHKPQTDKMYRTDVTTEAVGTANGISYVTFDTTFPKMTVPNLLHTTGLSEKCSVKKNVQHGDAYSSSVVEAIGKLQSELRTLHEKQEQQESERFKALQAKMEQHHKENMEVLRALVTAISNQQTVDGNGKEGST